MEMSCGVAFARSISVARNSCQVPVSAGTGMVVFADWCVSVT